VAFVLGTSALEMSVETYKTKRIRRWFSSAQMWSSGQHSSGLQIHRSRVRFPALPDFVRSSGSGTGSAQPR
jgi:hypothetical protein